MGADPQLPPSPHHIIVARHGGAFRFALASELMHLCSPFWDQVTSSGPIFTFASEYPQGWQPPIRIADTIADTHIPTATPKIAAKTIADMSRFVVVPSRILTVVPIVALKAFQPCTEHNVVPPEAPNVVRELFGDVPVLARARNKSSERDVQEG